jgi:hypothetical protein
VRVPGPPWLAGAGLAAASAGVVVWQTAHVAVLYDIGYVLNIAYRIATGDVPYRDFPMPYPPLTFVVQALLIRIAGPHYIVQIVYAVVLGGAATALTYWIVSRIVGDWRLAATVCLPLAALGIYDIFPHPFYDPDAAFLMLLAIAAALLASRGASDRRWLLTGMLLPLPVLAKQNTGLAFLALMTLALGLTLARRRSALLAFGAGSLATLTGIALLLQTTAGLDNVIRWTVSFASARLATSPAILGWLADPSAVGSAALLLVAAATLQRVRIRAGAAIGAAGLTIPFVVIAVAAVLAPQRQPVLTLWPLAMIASCLASGIAITRQGLSLPRLLPFVVGGVATASFLSQGVSGSSYALWPLLAIAVAEPVRGLVEGARDRHDLVRIAIPMAAALVFFSGATYALGEYRLGFVDLNGQVARSTYPSLAGLATPGDYAPELDDALAAITALIPADEKFIAFPGEDPIFFALARPPRFPVTQFNSTVNPYSLQDLRSLRDALDVRWVLVKRHLQLRGALTGSLEPPGVLLDGFDLVGVAGPYDVYRERTP